LDAISLNSLADYWTAPAVATNIAIFLNLIGALALGLIAGYERTYQGRAVGMRTYGLVCMASTAVVVIFGAPTLWYGGHSVLRPSPDPSHVMQGVLTGIGFLGAGVIMREGQNIRGLTTAASIWSSSAIGILVGVGFYAAAILLTLLSAACMTWVLKLERWLPSRSGMSVVMQFKRDFHPSEKALLSLASERGYEIVPGSLAIAFESGCTEWRFVAMALSGRHTASISDLAHMMGHADGVQGFQLAHCRN